MAQLTNPPAETIGPPRGHLQANTSANTTEQGKANAALAALHAQPAWLRLISPTRLVKKLADAGDNAQVAVGVVSQLLLWALGAAALPALGPPEAGLTILGLLNLAILFWTSIARRSKMTQGMMVCYLLAGLAGILWWLAAGFAWPGAY
jgi:hypothetical protein